MAGDLSKTTTQKINLSVYKEQVEAAGNVEEGQFLDTFLEAFPRELRNTIELTAQQLEELRVSAYDSFGIQNTAPLICRGAECPFVEKCQFYKFGVAPVGYGCPEEKALIMRILPTIQRDMNVDPDNHVDMMVVLEYIDQIIQEHRARKRVSVEGDIVDYLTAVDPKTGEVKTDTKINEAINMQRDAQKAKERIRKERLLTPEMKKRYKTEEKGSVADREAELMKRYEELLANSDEAEYIEDFIPEEETTLADQNEEEEKDSNNE